jgi:hypothetical protein
LSASPQSGVVGEVKTHHVTCDDKGLVTVSVGEGELILAGGTE